MRRMQRIVGLSLFMGVCGAHMLGCFFYYDLDQAPCDLYPEPSPQIRPKMSRNAAWEDKILPKVFINWISRSWGMVGIARYQQHPW
jgi:hypothetical protein